MIRFLHRWPGVLAAVLVTVIALTGAALSLYPAAERLSAPAPDPSLTVAELATRIQTSSPEITQIRRSDSGKIMGFLAGEGRPQRVTVDPATGKIEASSSGPLRGWLINLHRSLFLGDSGRIVAAIGAAAMLVLSLTGAVMVARRMGGWRHWFSPARGALAGRLHVEIARFTVLGLALSSVTALWMSASHFDLLPEAAGPALSFPVSGQTGAAPAAISMFAETPVTDLRGLTFPAQGDASDVFTLKTKDGTGYLDQGTGEVLAWATPTLIERISGYARMLHTGQGAAILGLVLGLMALGVPGMAVTGIILWLAGRHARPRINGNQPARRAETVLLVGSEGGSTWGFAASLHKALTEAGQSVHVAPMSDFDPARYPQAKRAIILAATYGDGSAPASAKGFLDRFTTCKSAPQMALAVLGFGDRSFPAYCAYAQTVATSAQDMGWPQLLPFDTVDRQSPQDFARWGAALGKALGIPLELIHQPVTLATDRLTLVSRRDYGAEVQAPAAILRFALPRLSLWQRLTGQGFARYEPGDLLGVLPEGSDLPRLYSLAAGRSDGFVEIVVRKHPGGLCSGQLLALETGDSIRAFIRHNPGFRTDRKRTPLILIGAGCGVGPLAGFIRANDRKRHAHLFFGMRNRDSDFLYDQELRDWQQNGHLTQLVTACSRGTNPHYVQDALRAEAADVAGLIRQGARIMVCGGRDMAAGVTETLADILKPLGLTPATLKAEGRYVEDVF